MGMTCNVERLIVKLFMAFADLSMCLAKDQRFTSMHSIDNILSPHFSVYKKS